MGQLDAAVHSRRGKITTRRKKRPKLTLFQVERLNISYFSECGLGAMDKDLFLEMLKAMCSEDELSKGTFNSLQNFINSNTIQITFVFWL